MTVRQKRRVRLSSAKVSRKRSNAHFKKKQLPVPGIISQYWSKDQTLCENYKKLGLMVRLNGSTGGKQGPWLDNVPTTIDNIDENWTEIDGGYADPKYRELLSGNDYQEEAIVERDAEGNIVDMKIIRKEIDSSTMPTVKHAPTLPELKFAPKMQVELTEEAKLVRKELEELVANGINHKEIHLAPGEVEFIRECVKKYGDDSIAMARDIKLNRLQLTPAQIRRKIQRFTVEGHKL